MKRSRHAHGRWGFTLLELMLVVAIVAILAALLLPAVGRAKSKAKRLECLSHLKQMGLALHSFAHDHLDRFPPQVSTNNGGTMEFVMVGNSMSNTFYFAFRHVQVLSNELGEPRLLVCPADTRLPADNFAGLRNENVSYFTGVTADYSRPDSVLAGDRNVVDRNLGGGPVLRVASNDVVEWTAELHGNQGNLLFADGRVELVNNGALLAAIARSPAAQNTFLPPVAGQRNSEGAVVASESATNNALEQLDSLLSTKPGAALEANTRTRVTPEKARPQGSASESGPPPPASTNSPGTISTNAAAGGVGEPEISPWDKWPLPLAKILGQWGSKGTYLFLFIVLAILVTLEVLRRRRGRRRKLER